MLTHVTLLHNTEAGNFTSNNSVLDNSILQNANLTLSSKCTTQHIIPAIKLNKTKHNTPWTKHKWL